jgi:hypothetical protein
MMTLAAAGSLTHKQSCNDMATDLWILAGLNAQASHRRPCDIAATKMRSMHTRHPTAHPGNSKALSTYLVQRRPPTLLHYAAGFCQTLSRGDGCIDVMVGLCGLVQ